MAGDELYRIADHSHVWVIADVAEADIGSIKVGTPVTVILRADPSQPVRGAVTFIYPELRPETRTFRCASSFPIRSSADSCTPTWSFRPAGEAVIAADDVIDSGTRQVVLVARAMAVSSPCSEARPSRRGGYVGYRRPEAGRGGRDLGELPDRRRGNLKARCKPSASGRRSHDRRTHSLVARNVFLVGFATILLRSPDLCRFAVPLVRSDLSDVQVIVYTEYLGQAPRVWNRCYQLYGDANLAEDRAWCVASPFRRLLRLCDLRGRHRSLLGALARARKSELGCAALADRRDAESRTRRDRRGVGLPICGARRTDESSRAPYRPRLVHPIWTGQG